MSDVTLALATAYTNLCILCDGLFSFRFTFSVVDLDQLLYVSTLVIYFACIFCCLVARERARWQAHHYFIYMYIVPSGC